MESTKTKAQTKPPKAGTDYPRNYAEFIAWFPDDAACLDYLDWIRWKDGFTCPTCAGIKGWRMKNGRWWCDACRNRVSATAGTIFHHARMYTKEKLVPGGILEPVTGRSFLFFGTHYKTSDFMVDGIFMWWEERKQELFGMKQLVINLDNGPECNGHRSQFLLRMTEFADMTGLCVRLVYYPPYHSKYNGIERYWAGLEKSWNGYLLSTVDTVLSRAGNFLWKGMRTVARLLDAPYEKGVTVCGNERIELEQRLQRSPVLHWWDITIHPKFRFLDLDGI